jgi:hypothetical protein
MHCTALTTALQSISIRLPLLQDHLIQEAAAAKKLKTGDRGTYLTRGSSGTSLRLSPSSRQSWHLGHPHHHRQPVHLLLSVPASHNSASLKEMLLTPPVGCCFTSMWLNSGVFCIPELGLVPYWLLYVHKILKTSCQLLYAQVRITQSLLFKMQELVQPYKSPRNYLLSTSIYCRTRIHICIPITITSRD